MRTLVVEDNVILANRIAEGLRIAGMAVDVVHDGQKALEMATIEHYDLVVLDRDLPGMHGDEVCRALAALEPRTRILMLTASGSVRDRVAGLELGADDYLGKPFAFPELVARARALFRRNASAPPVVTIGTLVVDRSRQRAIRDNQQLSLTRKEFGILECLVAAEGQVVSAEQLLDQVWDVNTDPFTNTVSVTMARLRRKLGEPPLIETVIGSGYRL